MFFWCRGYRNRRRRRWLLRLSYELGEYELGEYELGEYELGEYELGEYELGNTMAITWKADLSIVQLSGSIVSITVTRTDDDMENPIVWSYTLENINVSTNGQTLIEIRDRVADTIWGAWLNHVERSTAIQSKKDTYESAIAAALQAREI